jgi:hypothetical protein
VKTLSTKHQVLLLKYVHSRRYIDSQKLRRDHYYDNIIFTDFVFGELRDTILDYKLTRDGNK